MRRIVLLSWCLILTATAGGGVWAAQRVRHHMVTKPHVSSAMPDVAKGPIAEDAPLATGRIVTVDPQQGRVTIAQNGVGRFYIEPGTRVFHVPDSSLLTGLTPGDKVRFDIERDGKRFAITRLENTN